MTLIEELLQIFEELYDTAYQSGAEDMTSSTGDYEQTAASASQKALEKLRREISSNLSYGDENQVEDPRSRYIDVQADKEFYAWYMQGGKLT